jgi:hypothetical protein
MGNLWGRLMDHQDAMTPAFLASVRKGESPSYILPRDCSSYLSILDDRGLMMIVAW